jgi:ABC-2 type transport system permease protein
MFKEILKFELAYRKKRPATYIYFGILFLIGFLIVATDAIQITGSGGQFKENGTQATFQTFSIINIFGIFIASAIMGVSIIRDFEHQTEALFFTTNLTKFDYLFGRFLGSFLVLILVFTAIPLGIMLGDLMPWREASRMLPFRLGTYCYYYLLLVIPNAFIMASIFFTVGALSRKMIIVFMQGVLFILINSITGKLFSQIDKKEIAALADPFGLRAAGIQTQYWSIAQKNNELLSLNGDFLWNRLLWIGVSIFLLFLTYRIFSFQQILNPVIRKRTSPKTIITNPNNALIPKVVRHFNNYFLQIVELTKIYFKNIVKDLPFIGLLLCGILFFIFTTTSIKGWYQTTVIPSTYLMIDNLSILTGLFAMILAIMYTGELIWKERSLRMNLIHDSLPISSFTVMAGKFLGLLLSFCAIFLVGIFISLIIQTFKGFYDYQFSLYFKKLFGADLLSLVIFMLLGFFVHNIVNNKFLGHGIMILILIIDGVLGFWGVEHNLLRINSATTGQYSEMNGFGHFISLFNWTSLYWVAITAVLFGLGTLLSVRGSEELMKFRLKIGKHQLSKSIFTFFIFGTILFVSSGSYIYYNTNVLNKFKTSKDNEKESANYEKTLKKFENTPQPKITDVKLNIDLMPESRDFLAEGYYWLKNKTTKPIIDLQIMAGIYDDLNVEYLKLSTPNTLDSKYVKDYSFYQYKLSKPLNPNDSIKLEFKVKFQTNGFKQGSGGVDVLNNGTFFNNSYFPLIGYSDIFELMDEDKRKKQGLKDRPRALERNNPMGLSQNVFGDDADFINFDITIATAPDQIAIAPGYLQKEWSEKGKKYFHYVMDTPICNFYSIVSARYAVKKENYKGINLEIYHHPSHTKNIDRMVKSMKASLDYYQTNFGPYQYRQLRIMEFPRYKGFAQSFANTIPFGEEMGFVADIDDKKDIDMPFFVTAHEIAHQWWGHQAAEANVQGAGFLSESLAEYSALMTMAKKSPKEQIQKFLRNELEYYLQGRATERKKEMPLATCEKQSYIHYNKGAVVLYSIQDYIGEAKLNTAIRNYLQKWNTKVVAKTGLYANSNDLINEIKAVTPDSLQYIVTDFIENITIYENKAVKAVFKKVNEKYQVTLNIDCQKLRADSLGNEKPMKLNEWIWVGVYGKPGKDEKDKLIYYQRHRINQAKQNITVWIKEAPLKAGVDPLNLLIDRHVKDNIINIEI